MHVVIILALIFISTVFSFCCTPFLSAVICMILPEKAASFIVLNLPHLLILLLIAISCPLVLKKGIMRLFTDAPHFRPAVFLVPFAVTFAVLTLSLAFLPVKLNEAVLSERVILFTLSIVIIPLQCLCEELVTRAMLARIFLYEKLEASWLKALAISLAGATVFALLHTAASTAAYFYYFLFGFLSCFAGIRLSGFEAGLGVHAANNLFIALVMNSSSSPYNTDSIFTLEGETSIAVCIIQLVLIFLLSALIDIGGSNLWQRKNAISQEN